MNERFIAMIYKLPCKTQRWLDTGLKLRLVFAARVVILGACDDNYDEAFHTPRPMSVGDIAGILKQCRPSIEDLLTDRDKPQMSPCMHPDDAQVQSYGQLVCTLCGLCTGCVYERP